MYNVGSAHIKQPKLNEKSLAILDKYNIIL